MSESFEYDSNLCLNITKHFSGMFFRCRIDTDYTLLSIGRGVENLLGYTSEELGKASNTTFLQLVHPEDRIALEMNRSYQLQKK
ncbi:MAG: hypothetical protein R2852_01430 [Bacteroidia bacterium]